MAQYLTSSASIGRTRRGFLRPIAGFFALALAMIGAATTAATVGHESASADLTNEIVCNGVPFMDWAGPDGDAKLFGKDSVTYNIYRVTHTDDLHFAFESKSTVNSGVQDVDGALNSFISWGKSESFTKINERILGVNLTSGEALENAAPNSGARVTAYDRFGMAGLSWTRYNGEWRYPYVDICSKGEPRDLKLGVLYADRLEPLTTYDGVKDTKDVRTAQFGKGLVANLGEGFLNTTANWTFDVTKAIVAVAVGLVNVSFANFTKLLKLDDLIGGDSGVFVSLYHGIYQPFILIVMALVGILIAYKGIVKRQFRGALTMLFRSVAMFLISIVIFSAPAFWVTLPNNAAVVLQSIVINTMSTSLASGSGICTTDGGSSKEVETNPGKPGSITDAKAASDLLTRASENMRSVVGCQIWATFLVKPWSLGQFGADYNKLYAQGHIPKGAYGDTGEVKIDNESMVGDAAVPVGGDSYIYNWALYQISTGTNAHAQTPGGDDTDEPADPALAVYTNGIANDWYRIVDAMANYNEKETTIQDPNNQANGQSIDSVRFAEPDTSKKPTPYWSTWVGGNSIQRIGIAFTSIISALAGLFTIIIFGFLSAIYGFGIVLMMAFAPIFFLAGSYGDRGWETFKAWGQTLLNLMMKRVLMGVILVLNLVILTTVLNMMADQDYFWGVAALSLTSFMLFKFKDKIVSTVGGIFTFNFANQNMEGKLGAFTGKLQGSVRKISYGVSNVGVAGVAGGIAAARNGGTFGEGLIEGVRKETKQQAYYSDSDFMKNTLRVAETLDTKGIASDELCIYCGQTLESVIGEAGTVISDANGNKYHVGCAYEKFGGPDNIPNGWGYQQITIRADGKSTPKKLPVQKTRSQIDVLGKEEIDKALRMASPDQQSAGSLVGEAFAKDTENPDIIPAIPEILRPYLGDNIPFIEAAIKSGDPNQLIDVILIYAQALVAYAYTNKIASPGDFSASPNNPGTQDEDVRIFYNDILQKVRRY